MKKRIKVGVGLVILIIILQLFVVRFISIFDRYKRHGIEGPAVRKEIALAKEKQKVKRKNNLPIK